MHPILAMTSLHAADLKALVGGSDLAPLAGGSHLSRPRTLLIVVKGAHVGSVWLKELFNLQAPTAYFVHEANQCARSLTDIRQLLGSGTCGILNKRPSQLGCVSFNTGNFGSTHFADWEAAAHSVLRSPLWPQPRVIVASLIRANAAKWAWSVWRHQNTTQQAHVYGPTLVEKPVPFGAVHARPVRVDANDMADQIVAMAKRARVVQADAVKLARLLNTTVASHLTYERLQRGSLGEIAHLFQAAGEPFSAAAHTRGTQLLKAAPEDLSLAIANLGELRAHPAIVDPCYQAMFVPEAREMRPCDGGPPWLA